MIQLHSLLNTYLALPLEHIVLVAVILIACVYGLLNWLHAELIGNSIGAPKHLRGAKLVSARELNKLAKRSEARGTAHAAPFMLGEISIPGDLEFKHVL
jgi:hypothetical protein